MAKCVNLCELAWTAAPRGQFQHCRHRCVNELRPQVFRVEFAFRKSFENGTERAQAPSQSSDILCFTLLEELRHKNPVLAKESTKGVVTFVLLERGGFGRRKSARIAFFAAALSTPLGTLLSYPFISRIEPSVLGILLALSAGALVYVGASHLLPEVERENRRYAIFALAVGVLVAAIIILSKG